MLLRQQDSKNGRWLAEFARAIALYTYSCMTRTWIKPFRYDQFDKNLRLDWSGVNPWIEVELRGHSAPIYRLRAKDKDMGKRLAIQLGITYRMVQELKGKGKSGLLRVQLHDEDPGLPCIRTDAPRDDAVNKSPLIPDAYRLGSGGYSEVRRMLQTKNMPAWSERIPMIFWRGATTGRDNITLNTLRECPRYVLCKHSTERSDVLDAKFNRVVQCPTELDKSAVEALLVDKSLVSATVPAWVFSLHCWQIDIDGNVNSWGLLWKLLSGSCILKVKSTRKQWFYHRLKEWEHYVPISHDLSDLDQLIDWCLENREESFQISRRATALALSIIEELDLSVYDAMVRYSHSWLE